jgi:hypothetical protein
LDTFFRNVLFLSGVADNSVTNRNDKRYLLNYNIGNVTSPIIARKATFTIGNHERLERNWQADTGSDTHPQSPCAAGGKARF